MIYITHGTVSFSNGSWFVHSPELERVLGPFKYEKQAWRALKEALEEKSWER